MGRREDIAARIRAIVEPIVAREGVELVDVEVLGSGPRTIVRLTIDKQGGVSLDDCSNISRTVDGVLEVEDPIDSAYSLEVSSPGLERPLKRPEDFVRFRGQKAKVTTFSTVGDRKVFVGTLQGYESGDVLVDLGGGDLRRVPHGQVSRAHLKFDLDQTAQPAQKEK